MAELERGSHALVSHSAGRGEKESKGETRKDIKERRRGRRQKRERKRNILASNTKSAIS